MSSEHSTPTVARRRARTLGGIGAGLVVVIGGYLAIRGRTPGNMAEGFLTGGLLALVVFGIVFWRSSRWPAAATTAERAWTQTGDERDDLILTRALAVLGFVAVPLTGVATIFIAMGAGESMVLALLLFTELAVGVAAFWVIARRT